MIDWLLKQYMTWCADSDTSRGKDCFPGWLRRRIRNSPSLQLHEKSLHSISLSLRRASSEHLEESVSLMRSYESPEMIRSVAESETNRATHRAPVRNPSRMNDRSWGMWPRLSIAVCSIVLIFIGARWTYSLLSTRVATENVVQNTSKGRKVVDKRDTDRLLQSSLAIGQRWTLGLESKKNSMKLEVDQLDRKFVAEARELRKRSVHFVTHHVPVSAVRMFLPSSDSDTN